MVDIEDEVFDRVATALLEAEPGVFVTSTYVQAPASFPAASLIQANSSTDTRRLDSTGMERATMLTFELNVYSNLRTGARRQAKRLAETADRVMVGLGFNRTMMSRMDNPADSSIYRITARYYASVDDSETIYRR